MRRRARARQALPWRRLQPGPQPRSSGPSAPCEMKDAIRGEYHGVTSISRYEVFGVKPQRQEFRNALAAKEAGAGGKGGSRNGISTVLWQPELRPPRKSMNQHVTGAFGAVDEDAPARRVRLGRDGDARGGGVGLDDQFGAGPRRSWLRCRRVKSRSAWDRGSLRGALVVRGQRELGRALATVSPASSTVALADHEGRGRTSVSTPSCASPDRLRSGARGFCPGCGRNRWIQRRPGVATGRSTNVP
jgi:hypothetical protein